MPLLSPLQSAIESPPLLSYNVILISIFCNSRSNSSNKSGTMNTSLKIKFCVLTCPISDEQQNKIDLLVLLQVFDCSLFYLISALLDSLDGALYFDVGRNTDALGLTTLRGVDALNSKHHRISTGNW